MPRARATLSLNPLAALFVGHPVVVLIDLLLAVAPLSGQPSMLPTVEQPGPGCTWLVQKVSCALHALQAHEDATQHPAAGTGSADALAIIGKRSGGGGGWRYTDAPVRGTRSMIGLDSSHEKIVSP